MLCCIPFLQSLINDFFKMSYSLTSLMLLAKVPEYPTLIFSYQRSLPTAFLRRNGEMVDMLMRRLGRLTDSTESLLRWVMLMLRLAEKGLSANRCDKLMLELFVLLANASGL
ncbi:MAG: hypothetical protein BWY72_02071 [Bacteroidetes bacterium ADurb.Bin416]|nr:MAG: hypothetical protein BWY72_02071 [Bacteroidetes bacterium ADurb.Bin416]